MTRGAALACLAGILAAGAALLHHGARPRQAQASPPPYVVSVIAGAGTAPGQLNNPRAVAFDGRNTCYVMDFTDRVQAFDVATGRFLRLWRLPDIRQGKPERLAVAGDGSLYVTDTHYFRVLHYDCEGVLLDRFDMPCNAPGQMHYPVGLCLLADGRLAVTEYGGHDRILLLERGGAPVLAFGRGGMGPGEFIQAQGVSEGPDGNLYVADAANQRIQVFRRDGAFLRAFGEGGQGPGHLDYPYDLGFDPQGRLAVLEHGSDRISLWTPGGKWLGELGGTGASPGRLSSPCGLAVLGDGTVLVTNTHNHRIERWRLP